MLERFLLTDTVNASIAVLASEVLLLRALKWLLPPAKPLPP